MSDEKKSVDQIKIGSIMRVKTGAYEGFIGRVKKIDERGVDLFHFPTYIHPDNVEPVEIDEKKNFSIGDIVRPVGAFRAGQLCKVVTKVIYYIQDIDGCVYESEQICEADEIDQKKFVTARCKSIQKQVANAQQSAADEQAAAELAASKAQEKAAEAQKQAQTAIQASTTFLATYGSLLDPKDFCALTSALLADK